MQVAQKLYEGIPLDDASTPVALITYMRTDSLRISDIAIKQADAILQRNYGKELSYLPSPMSMQIKGKAAQDAHEASTSDRCELNP